MAYSYSVHTSLHFGAKDFVTAKHSPIFAQGYTSHCAQFGMPHFSQHAAT